MLRRGFKTLCETLAESFRNELGIKPDDPLNPHLLAINFNIVLLTPNDIKNLSKETINILTKFESDSWSALTLSQNRKHIIIYNPSHSPSRQANDIMHELSHIILDHKPQIMHSFETGIFLRHFNRNQEEEANWLAATILLPKKALIKIKYCQISNEVAAKKYFVSIKLLKMRLNVSGTNYIYKSSKKAKYKQK